MISLRPCPLDFHIFFRSRGVGIGGTGETFCHQFRQFGKSARLDWTPALLTPSKSLCLSSMGNLMGLLWRDGHAGYNYSLPPLFEVEGGSWSFAHENVNVHSRREDWARCLDCAMIYAVTHCPWGRLRRKKGRKAPAKCPCIRCMRSLLQGEGATHRVRYLCLCWVFWLFGVGILCLQVRRLKRKHGGAFPNPKLLLCLGQCPVSRGSTVLRVKGESPSRHLQLIFVCTRRCSVAHNLGFVHFIRPTISSTYRARPFDLLPRILSSSSVFRLSPSPPVMFGCPCITPACCL